MPWIERQRHIIDFTLSSLARRKGKNGAILVVYTVLVFIISSVIFFTHALRRQAVDLLQNAPQMIVQRMVAGRHDLIPVSYRETLQKIRGVLSVQARFWGYYYHPPARANYTVMAADDATMKDDEAAVGSGVARTWGAGAGDTLFFRSHSGTVMKLKAARVLSADTELVAADLILVTKPAFLKLFGVTEALATDLGLEIGNPGETATIAEKIMTALPDTRLILREDILRTYSAIFDWRSGYIIVLLSGAVLAFAIFAWDKATGLSAEEKAEIGILKAIGWDTTDVLLLKFWEGTVISLSAFLTGVIAGFAHVFFSSAPLFSHALKGWSILYPSFRLTPDVDLYQIALLFFFTVVPYAFITIIPAWRAAVTEPDAVMR